MSVLPVASVGGVLASSAAIAFRLTLVTDVPAALRHMHAGGGAPPYNLGDDGERRACLRWPRPVCRGSWNLQGTAAAVRAVVQLTFQFVIGFDASVSKTWGILSSPPMPTFSDGNT